MTTKFKPIPGKFYVVDNFSGPIDQPFDTAAEAEVERRQLNIDEDCDVGECFINENKKLQLRRVDPAVIAMTEVVRLTKLLSHKLNK